MEGLSRSLDGSGDCGAAERSRTANPRIPPTTETAILLRTRLEPARRPTPLPSSRALPRSTFSSVEPRRGGLGVLPR